LVLLGDIFDLWLYPINVPPWSVRQILDANPRVSAVLKQCVQRIPAVYYIKGNHDMEITEEDLAPLATSDDNHIQILSPEDYNCKYNSERHFEHGHAADMFNAADTSPDTIGGYPLGYFITRLVATSDASTVWKRFEETLESLGAVHRIMAPKALAVRSMGSLFVEAIISALQEHAHLEGSTRIRFANPALDNQFTIDDVKTHYSSLYGDWLRRCPDPEDFISAMLVSRRTDGLGRYAKKILADPTVRVLVMGHTHHTAIEGKYYNDGCWCGPSMSYVTIIGSEVKLVPCR